MFLLKEEGLQAVIHARRLQMVPAIQPRELIHALVQLQQEATPVLRHIQNRGWFQRAAGQIRVIQNHGPLRATTVHTGRVQRIPKVQVKTQPGLTAHLQVRQAAEATARLREAVAAAQEVIAAADHPAEVQVRA